MFRSISRLLLSSASGGSAAASAASTSSPNVLHATQAAENKLDDLSPRKIALILDKYIVGQTEGKRAVAISLRNRWRRRQIANVDLRKEVLPKNMLLIGPTGVGKTEISRRMARITDAPFVKVEATKYTEVGFKGKDVESIIEDLYTNAKSKARKMLEGERYDEALVMAIDSVYNAWNTQKYTRKRKAKNRKSSSSSSSASSSSSSSSDDNKVQKDGKSSVGEDAKTSEKDDERKNVNKDETATVDNEKGKTSKSKKKSKKDKGSPATANDNTTESIKTNNSSSNNSSSTKDEQKKDEYQAEAGVEEGEEEEEEATLEYFREHYKDKLAQDKVFIDIPAPQDPAHQKPNIPGGAFNAQAVGFLIGLGLDPRKSRIMVWKTVAEAIPLATQEALNKLMDDTQVNTLARALAEEEGIVFIDEIDKVVVEKNTQAADVSATGVQQDLLPLVEGSNVTMKDGSVIATDNMLFICSGAFHTAKTSDMIAELQGRLPVRVELKPLSEDDFRRILTEPKYNLLLQHKELMKTEGVDVEFTPDGINALAKVTCLVNTQGQNIGARRLNTILERVMDEFSFNCDKYADQTVKIDEKVVRDATEKLQKNVSIARYLLESQHRDTLIIFFSSQQT